MSEKQKYTKDNIQELKWNEHINYVAELLFKKIEADEKSTEKLIRKFEIQKVGWREQWLKRSQPAKAG